ncbi:hypothetical protein [Ralstonia solanacearum]|uniref:hypothetical protein n=1 Tax=Ralstonia solanacearum TaxID=305 RepID=UPI000E58A647|nr:hypothetical protein [Ralstonia solanacearum]AXW22514.1 hypothetical protein CJO86_02310 [Ralstonia solanacearum]
MNRGPLRRLSGEDFAVAEEVLKAATVLMLPEKTRARFFEEQIKTIQYLRDKGSSWLQIKSLLAEIGIDLSESTLRSYYARGTKVKAKKKAPTQR